MEKKIFYSKDMRGNYKSSRAMKSLMKNSRVKKVLDNPRERRNFFRELKKQRVGGVTKDEMRGILGKLRKSGGDSLDKGEVRVLADELIKAGRKYIPYSKPEEKKSISQRNDPAGLKGGKDITGSSAIASGGAKSKSGNAINRLRF